MREVNLEKLKIKLSPSEKKLIKAIWIHHGMLYIICLSKHIVKLTENFSKKYKITANKVRVGTIEDLIKEINQHNTRVLISIRDGKIIYDPYRLLGSLRINIRQGLMVGTREAILRKFMLIKDYLQEIDDVKRKVFDNIYTATVEAAQSALLMQGCIILAPRLIPGLLGEHLKGKGLEKEIKYATEIINLFKAWEHKRIPLPEGKKLDELAKKAEAFRDAVKKLK